MAAKPLKDISATEARKQFGEFRKMLGTRADITAGLTVSRWGAGDAVLYASVYPSGIGHGDQAFTVGAEDWRTLVAAVRDRWAAYSDEYAKRTIRDMALEIIRITAELGECTDAALRAGRFSTEEVARWGDQACADATEIAGLGPFRIVLAGSANHAEAA